MFWRRKKEEEEFSKIRFKRIDNTVIVVAEDIFQREFTFPDETELYGDLVKHIDAHNSKTANDMEATRSSILNIMMSVNMADIEEEPDKTLALAEEDMTQTERVELFKRVSTVHEQFEYDPKGYVYLKGFGVPIPKQLALAILDAHFNEYSNYTVDSLVNFWQWALLNPNKNARNDLFDWFKTGNFTITDSGLVVAYRCVNIKKQSTTSKFDQAVQRSYLKIKRFKEDPVKYFINDDGALFNYEKKGTINLADAYERLLEDNYGDIYTDNHTGTMTIKIGQEVSMARKACDEDQNEQCSRGLHFMSLNYGLRYGNRKLVILVNPMNIVAFPSYDQTKGRCCAYLPIAEAEEEQGDIKPFESGTYSFEYTTYTQDTLSKLMEEGNFEHLVKKGEIADDISRNDFLALQDRLGAFLKDKIVYVE